MTIERRKYTEAFKQEAVRLMETSGKPVAQRARDLGINDNNLYRWRSRPPSQHQQTDAVLLKAIQSVYQAGWGLIWQSAYPCCFTTTGTVLLAQAGGPSDAAAWYSLASPPETASVYPR
jgi:hypothetical protein